MSSGIHREYAILATLNLAHSGNANTSQSAEVSQVIGSRSTDRLAGVASFPSSGFSVPVEVAFASVTYSVTGQGVSSSHAVPL